MKTETYDYTSIDEAIERLQKLKAEGKNPKNIIILTMDFDNNISSKKLGFHPPNGGKDDHHGYLFLQLLRAVRRRRPKKRRTSVWGREVRRMAII